MREHQINEATFLELLFFILSIITFMLFAIRQLQTPGLVFAILVFSLMATIQSCVQIRREKWTSMVLILVSFSIFYATLYLSPY